MAPKNARTASPRPEMIDAEKGVRDASAALKPPTSVQRCVEEIRSLIFVGEFLPGQPLRQTQLAQRLETSRIPIREALTILESEGVLSYAPHVGHTVARLSSSQLAEIYTMRRMIETEILRSIDLADVDLEPLRRINEELREACEKLQVEQVTRLNVKFHFTLFEYSPYKVMIAELTRLWNMSGFYRSLQIHDEQHRAEMVDEHNKILEAVRLQELDRLVAVTDAHRSWRRLSHTHPLTRGARG